MNDAVFEEYQAERRAYFESKRQEVDVLLCEARERGVKSIEIAELVKNEARISWKTFLFQLPMMGFGCLYEAGGRNLLCSDAAKDFFDHLVEKGCEVEVQGRPLLVSGVAPSRRWRIVVAIN